MLAFSLPKQSTNHLIEAIQLGRGIWKMDIHAVLRCAWAEDDFPTQTFSLMGFQRGLYMYEAVIVKLNVKGSLHLTLE